MCVKRIARINLFICTLSAKNTRSIAMSHSFQSTKQFTLKKISAQNIIITMQLERPSPKSPVNSFLSSFL